MIVSLIELFMQKGSENYLQNGICKKPGAFLANYRLVNPFLISFSKMANLLNGNYKKVELFPQKEGIQFLSSAHIQNKYDHL